MLVNAHGAMILLSERVRDGQSLIIRNVMTSEECSCHVIETAGSRDGKFEVVVEFDRAAARFWRVIFPPDDWSIRSPEAKRFKNEKSLISRTESSE